jgi:hypothetical protein
MTHSLEIREPVLSHRFTTPEYTLRVSIQQATSLGPNITQHTLTIPAGTYNGFATPTNVTMVDASTPVLIPIGSLSDTTRTLPGALANALLALAGVSQVVAEWNWQDNTLPGWKLTITYAADYSGLQFLGSNSLTTVPMDLLTVNNQREEFINPLGLLSTSQVVDGNVWKSSLHPYGLFCANKDVFQDRRRSIDTVGQTVNPWTGSVNRVLWSGYETGTLFFDRVATEIVFAHRRRDSRFTRAGYTVRDANNLLERFLYGAERTSSVCRVWKYGQTGNNRQWSWLEVFFYDITDLDSLTSEVAGGKFYDVTLSYSVQSGSTNSF